MKSVLLDIMSDLIKVTIAPGFHLFPFRTEKLSPVTPMVLRNSGRVGSRRFQSGALQPQQLRGSFFTLFFLIWLDLRDFAIFFALSAY